MTLDYLGESVTSLAEADAATRDYLAIIDAIVAVRHRAQHLAEADAARARRRPGERGRQPAQDPRARRAGRVLRPHRHGELAVHRRHARDLRDAVAAGLPAASASCCSRRCTAASRISQRVNALGARVRLVKGAYKEPKTVAYQKKADVDAAYARMMKALLTDGTLPGDRHARSGDDRRWRGDARASTASRRIASSSRCCTASAATCRRCSSTTGYRVRVYVPFGREWFPYFMRRLGERPANVVFVLRGIVARTWVARFHAVCRRSAYLIRSDSSDSAAASLRRNSSLSQHLRESVDLGMPLDIN